MEGGGGIYTERGFRFMGMKVIGTVLHLDHDDGSGISAKFFFLFFFPLFDFLFCLCFAIYLFC